MTTSALKKWKQPQKTIWKSVTAIFRMFYFFHVLFTLQQKTWNSWQLKKIEEIHQKIQEILKKLAKDDVIAQHKVKDGVSKRLKSDNSVFDWLDNIVKQTSQCEPDALTSRSKVEFMHFLAEPDTRKHSLLWWKTKQSMFPILYILAKKYPFIPASSVTSERIFSTARNLINHNRAYVWIRTENNLMWSARSFVYITTTWLQLACLFNTVKI